MNNNDLGLYPGNESGAFDHIDNKDINEDAAIKALEDDLWNQPTGAPPVKEESGTKAAYKKWWDSLSGTEQCKIRDNYGEMELSEIYYYEVTQHEERHPLESISEEVIRSRDTQVEEVVDETHPSWKWADTKFDQKSNEPHTVIEMVLWLNRQHNFYEGMKYQKEQDRALYASTVFDLQCLATDKLESDKLIQTLLDALNKVKIIENAAFKLPGFSPELLKSDLQAVITKAEQFLTGTK